MDNAYSPLIMTNFSLSPILQPSFFVLHWFYHLNAWPMPWSPQVLLASVRRWIPSDEEHHGWMLHALAKATMELPKTLPLPRRLGGELRKANGGQREPWRSHGRSFDDQPWWVTINEVIFNGGLIILGFFFWSGLGIIFGFLLLCFSCFSAFLLFLLFMLFLLLCFFAFLLLLLLAFSAFLLFCFSCFSASLLFCFFAFLFFLFLCFSAFPVFPASLLFCFSCFFAFLLFCFCAFPVSLLLCFFASLLFCFFAYFKYLIFM